jgi:hypothetical protein
MTAAPPAPIPVSGPWVVLRRSAEPCHDNCPAVRHPNAQNASGLARSVGRMAYGIGHAGSGAGRGAGSWPDALVFMTDPVGGVSLPCQMPAGPSG